MKKRIAYYALKHTSANKLRFGANMVRMMGSNVLNRALGMICNMLITRLMTKYDYGIWSFVCNIYGYLSLITGLGLLSGGMLFGSEHAGERKEYDFYGYALKIGALIDVGLVVAFIFITYFTGFLIDDADIFIRFFVPVLVLEYAQNTFNCMLRSDNRIKDYSWSLNINTVLIAVSSIVGAAYGVWGLVIGRYIGVIVTLAFQLRMVWDEAGMAIHNNPLTVSEKKEMWRYSLCNGASSAMNCALYLVDVSMIAALIKNAEDVASYRVSTLIPNAIEFIPGSLVVVILPNVIAHREDREWLHANLRKMIRYLAAFNAVLVAFLVVLAPFIVTIISGQKYLSSVPAFRILAVGYLINGTFRTMSVNCLAVLRRVRYNFIISAVSVLCDVVFNYFFIINLGNVGAAYATLGVEIVASVMSYRYLLKHLRSTEWRT